MSLKFCANLSFMFQETPTLLARYNKAKEAGFRGVECAFPYDLDLDELVAVKENAGVEQVLINAPPGDWLAGDRGLAACPGRESEFKETVETAICFARALDCTRIHFMAGSPDQQSDKNLSVYINNLKLASEKLEDNDVVGLIEPINKYSLPNYYLNSYDRALRVLREVGSDNVKLQLDLFHLQHITGNLTKNLEALLPYVGHIQIAQVPNRNEPDTAGEINYKYIFGQLEKHGYDGWIGCEYNPAGKTEDGLKWVTDMGYDL